MNLTKRYHKSYNYFPQRLIAVMLFMFCTSSYANIGDGRPVIRYKIIEDVFDKKVAKGTTLITGVAKLEEEFLPQGIVGTVDNLKTTATDLDGKFSLEVSTTDSMIYFFKPRYEEIVTAKMVFKSQHHITIEFYPIENIIIQKSAKPVIYLYSEVEQWINLELIVHGQTTFTYPELGKSWLVNANQSGSLTDKSGNTYPYLFWEGEHEHLDYAFSDGSDGHRILQNSYQIKTDTVIQFLEHQLTAIGLNSTEKTDFITYWGPRLIEKEFALIQFSFNESYSRRIAELKVEPKPTASLRVYMMFSGLDEYHYEIKCSPNTIAPFKRSTYTLIEWGGTKIELPKNLF